MTTDDYKDSFSTNLLKLMSKHNVSQSDMIRDLKINKSTISTWCNGTRLPRLGTIKELANYFNVDISELINLPIQDTNILIANENKTKWDKDYLKIYLNNIGYIVNRNIIESRIIRKEAINFELSEDQKKELSIYGYVKKEVAQYIIKSDNNNNYILTENEFNQLKEDINNLIEFYLWKRKI